MFKNKRWLVVLVNLIFLSATQGQNKLQVRNEAWRKIYRSTAEKVHDLVHTKLDVKFNYQNSTMDGKAWITLKPHFYSSDSVTLDAKGMDIKKVALWKNNVATDLSYTYPAQTHLKIKLDKSYKAGETFTVFVNYTAKPNELKAEGSAAIKDAKGLYFINPLGEEKNKPTQIWTQGETEASSVWFPTIDKPNQKTTSEISMTVPAKYVTLSNGKLALQKTNADGTRTDTWKMDLPHSPYLFFMGVGDFAVVKDAYKGKEVSYYVEKDFEKVARKIFGLTPKMIAFYSSKLGVEYPWQKYAQIVGRDYVSGAMENTTATLHSEYLQQNARQLTDGNQYEDYISHELFHQWFGDLVTAESWSNLTVNESFANYGETLWKEYKYGADDADQHNYQQMNDYLQSRGENKHLVRFYYNDKEDMFDRVTYEKGGRILHMLRNVVGDDAFFKSLNLYLTSNKFKNAEAQNLRLAFEEVTGKDLSWFWNQWYYNSGHPNLEINYGYNEGNKNATVIVKQLTQNEKVFKLPVAIDVYEQGRKTRHNVWVENAVDTFSFVVNSNPELINFDADKILLVEKKENKTLAQYIYQYKNAKKYVDRREAVDFALENKQQEGAVNFLVTVLNDPFFELRERVLQGLRASDVSKEAVKQIESIARKDEKRSTRAYAIDFLANVNNPAYESFFEAGTKDSSYSVAGASLVALANLNESKALALLPVLEKDQKGRLKEAITEVEILKKSDADFSDLTEDFDSATPMQKLGKYKTYINFLGNVNNTENFRKGLDKVIAFRNLVTGFAPEFKTEVNDQLQRIISKKERLKNKDNETAMNEQVRLLESKLK